MNENYAQSIAQVCESLKRSSTVDFTKYDLEGEPGESRVAYALIEITEAAEQIIGLVNSVRQCASTNECDELISNLRDELAHLVYHINDSGLYSSLLNEVD